MPTFTDLLPPTKSAPRSGFKWTPSEDRVGCGLLVIEAPRVSVTYLVCEFATRWDGRAWYLAKMTEGTDKGCEAYDCFVGRNGQDKQCSCKGFIYGRGKACKHLASLESIFTENAYLLGSCPVDLDADTRGTEVNELPETI